ncbi:MAG: periplasmic heavy metal sensor, partial [Pseudomonadota bacterium]
MTRSLKTLVAALIASLMMNFAALGFIGVYAGRDYVYQSFIAEPDVGQDIPREVREAFKLAIRSDRGRLLESLRVLRAARDSQHSVLTAETFDPAALEATQADVRAAAGELFVVLQRALRETAATLPDDVRRTI